MENDSKFIVVCRRHWVFFAFRLLFAFIIYRVCAVYGYSSSGKSMTWLFDLAAVIFAIASLVQYCTDYIAITDRKVVSHQGFIRSSTRSCPISSVQNVSYNNGLLGKLFGYHTITVDNAGSGSVPFVFKKANTAKLFSETLYNLMDVQE